MNKFTNWAWRQERLPAIAKLALLALAKDCDDDGVYRLGTTYVAGQMRMNKTSAFQGIRILTERSLVTREYRRDSNNVALPSWFRLNTGKL